MPNLPVDALQKLSNVMPQICMTVSSSFSEACGDEINFETPLTVTTKTTDMYSELSAPMLVIQFAFASAPDRLQSVLIPRETALPIINMMSTEPVEELDDAIVGDHKAKFEALVQGVCVAVGSLLSETIVASDLTVKYQIFAFPPNLQNSPEILRTQVAVTGGELNGTAMWLIDPETAATILGVELEDEEEQVSAFPQIEGSLDAGSRAAAGDSRSIDRLLDIPLEISVELGRMKMYVRDIVELATGSIVEINKAAGEPVDVMVNGRLVARGEVVVIEDNFGVRVTEILNPAERVAKLGDAA